MKMSVGALSMIACRRAWAARRSASARRRSVMSTSWQRKYSGRSPSPCMSETCMSALMTCPSACMSRRSIAYERRRPASSSCSSGRSRCSSAGWLISASWSARMSCSLRPSICDSARFRRSQRPSRSMSAMPIGASSKARRKSCSAARSASSTRRLSVTSWAVPRTIAGRALVVEHDLAARVDHPRLLVGPDDPVVQRPAAALGHGRLDDPGHAGAVVLVDLVEVAAVGAGQAVRPHPVDPVELVGPHDVVGGQVPLPAAEPGDLLGLGELGLVGRQPGGLGAAGRDVEDLEDVVERDVARVADGRRADEHDRLRAVGAPQPRLALGADLVVAGHALGGPRAALLAPHDHVGQAQAGQLGHVDPEDAPERVVAALDPPLDVHDGHAQRRAGEGVDEALRVGLLQAGHVASDGEQATVLAVEHGLRLEPAARAVAAHDPEAEAPVRAALRELGEARADRLGVLRIDDVEERAAHDLLRRAADELERRRVGQLHHAVDPDDGHRVVREGEQARLGRVGRAVRGRRVGHLRPVAGDGRRRTRVEAAPVGVGEPMERPSGATNGRMRAPDGGAGRAGRRAPTRPVGCGAQWPPTHARPMPRPRSRSTS